MRRLTAILLVAALAAPGLWWRSSAPPAVERSLPSDGWQLNLRRIAVPAGSGGELEVSGAWAMTSDYPGFGSYSALVALGDGRLFAASDTGRMLAFAPPGAPRARVEMDFFAGRLEPNKYLVDIEGMTRDPVSGRIWVAYEGCNAIERFEADLTGARRARPPAMRDWPGNTGPEGLLRLADGRFLVLSESRAEYFESRFAALLFPGDPVEGAVPARFAFAGPAGFRPVDAAELPDGRVLILLRKVTWLPPGFESRIVVADPAEIRAGQTWRGREIAAIATRQLSENYEGLTVESLPDGAVRLWLISDDNRSALQRTQLLALRWDRWRSEGRRSRPQRD